MKKTWIELEYDAIPETFTGNDIMLKDKHGLWVTSAKLADLEAKQTDLPPCKCCQQAKGCGSAYCRCKRAFGYKWPRVRDLPEERRAPFELWLAGSTRPLIENLPQAEQDFYYDEDYVTWINGGWHDAAHWD